MGAKALAAEKPGKDNPKPDKIPKGGNEKAAPVLPNSSPITRAASEEGKGKNGKGKI